VCENNQYAGDTPVASGLAAHNVADLAEGYGMPGVVVDGNDVLMVYAAAHEAVERARSGAGPTLLECKTWRHHVHAVREVPPPDRRPAQLKAEWEARDPIPAFERYLQERGLLNSNQMADFELSIDRSLEDAVAFANASPYPAPEQALEDVFA
jgi:pyruvate dehydrogenase E1 component alpha subunit